MIQDVVGLEKEIQDNIDETDQTKMEFRKMQRHVGSMVDTFKKCKFFLSVAQKMSYEDGFTFNESNVIQYLAELEEYISSLITYQAFKRDDPNAAISAIPLEKLNQKDYKQNIMSIDAPVNYEINDESGAMG